MEMILNSTDGPHACGVPNELKGSPLRIQDRKRLELRKALLSRSSNFIKCETSSPHVIAAARCVVKKYNKIKGNKGKTFELKRIVEAKMQLVMSRNLFLLTLEEKNGCFYEAGVWMRCRVRDTTRIFKHA